MPRPSHPPWLDHSNYTWRRVQVTKLLIKPHSPNILDRISRDRCNGIDHGLFNDIFMNYVYNFI
jgi:hypothetical protein